MASGSTRLRPAAVPGFLSALSLPGPALATTTARRAARAMRVRVRIVTMELSWKLFLARSCSDEGRETGEQLTATLLLVDAAHLPDLPFIGYWKTKNDPVG